MKVSTIDFGKEIIENYRLKNPLPKKAVDQLIDFEIKGNRFNLIYENNIYEIIDVTAKQQRVIEEISLNKSKIIMRLESMGRINAVVTIMFMMNYEEFDDNNPLEIYLNSKIEMDLLKRNIRDDRLKFFKEHFILNDICFALLPRKAADPITLLGDTYICKLKKTSQGILEVYDISRRRADIYNASVTLFRGNIKFIDQIGNKTQLTKEIEKKFQESTKNNETLMKLWTLYSDAEVALRKKEIDDIGTVNYIKHKHIQSKEGELSIEFQLDKSADKSFVNAKSGYEITFEGERQKIFLGEKSSLSGERDVLTIYGVEDVMGIPTKGKIGGTISGSIVSNRRRMDAQNRINNGKAALTSMKLIIQTGESNLSHGKVFKPVDSKINEQIFGNKDTSFTERQKSAIDAAINTPDVALIQGPPGTGKTTVIRAIIARLNKIGNGNLKILVTSAQHDAVDNAVEKVEYGGLPANRIGGKFGSNERQKNRKMKEWIFEIQNKCDVYLDDAEAKEKQNELRDIAIQIDMIRIDSSDELNVIQNLESIKVALLGLGINSDVIGKINEMIASLNNLGNINQDVELELYQKKLRDVIDKQRLNVKSYLDDGPINQNRLIAIINHFGEIEFKIPEYWYDMLDVDETSEDLGKALVLFSEDLKLLESKYLNSNQKNIELLVNLDDKIDDLLLEVIASLKVYSDKEIDATSNCIWEFKEKLNSPNSVQRLIKEYASVNAATCQQAVSDNFFSSNMGAIIDYDYVIIDEAARANPLDLAIPMSIGKKVILVGDHMQLPHFLESDIVDEVVKQKNDSEVENLLKESLFSRMYKLVGQNSGSISKTVFLSEQYRMHPLICKLVNEFYDNGLVSPLGETGKKHALDLYNNKALAWLDVPIIKGVEKHGVSKSLYRTAEIDVIIEELEKILAINDKYTIGIISFYSEQVDKIERRVSSFTISDQERISVGTVDSYQGKEFDVVFLSTVRSNTDGQLGFINSPNRLNVAFSRAKKLLIGVGDCSSVAFKNNEIKVQQLSNMVQLCLKEGYYEQR